LLLRGERNTVSQKGNRVSEKGNGSSEGGSWGVYSDEFEIAISEGLEAAGIRALFFVENLSPKILQFSDCFEGCVFWYRGEGAY
jgi:hypothetical protein